MKKFCKDCGKNIEVKVVALRGDHDISIVDTMHGDNFITITKDEAVFVVKQLRKILKI